MGVPCLIPHPAPGHDLRDPLRVAGIEIPPAFENLEHVFLVSQTDQRGALGAELCDVKGRVEGPLLRRRPFEIAANAVFAPGWGVGDIIIKRRAAVGEKRGGHKGSVGLDGYCVQRRIFIGGIGRVYWRVCQGGAVANKQSPRMPSEKFAG